MASEFGEIKSAVDPPSTQKEGTRNKKIILVTHLLLLIGAATIALLFIFSGTKESESTYQTELLGARTRWSYTPYSSTTTTTTTTVPTVTVATPSVTINATANVTASTITATMPTTTATTITTTMPTRTAITITGVLTTTRNTPASQWRPMNPKTILCTFGVTAGPDTVGPRDGVCDIIIYDFFYAKGKGTFLDHTVAPLQWFRSYIRNNTGTTEFGIGIDHSWASQAATDLGIKDVQVAFQDFWSLKIRHYGLLKFPVHDDLVTTRATARYYINIFKRLRELQEVNRAGKFDEPGYLILGIGLYAPRNGTAHGYLKEILQNASIDAVVIRTHLEDTPQTGKGCKITGPNVYTNPFNKYEVSMVEALDYVNSNYDLFKGRSLMVSFSMSLFFAKPSAITYTDGFQVGRDCEYIQIRDMGAMCVHSKINYFNRLVPIQRVMHGFDRTNLETTTYDRPDTIKWKICMSTKRYPTLQFGVALFNLEHEDGTGKCSRFGSGRLTHMAGYWRVEAVLPYIKDVIRNPNFLTLDPACS